MGKRKGPKEREVPNDFKLKYNRMTITRLCIEYEVSKATIIKWAKHCNLSKKRTVESLSKKEVLGYLNDNKTPEEIAKITGFCYASILKRLNQLDLGTRNTVTVDIKEFSKLYKSGYSYKRLGNHFGYSETGMRDMVMRLGIYGR